MCLKKIIFKSIALSFSFFFTLIILEITCRVFLNYEANYYSSPKNIANKSSIEHSYGNIPINSEGFYDEEFNFKNNKFKIAYFGDSVTYGVGAGYPYRFTEVLDKIEPNFDHLNFSGGLGVSMQDWKKEIQEYLLSKGISRVVYVMNLNDIAPIIASINDKNINSKEIKNIKKLINTIKPVDSLLRGKSELYTFVRFNIKNYLVKKGYESSGFESIELFPDTNEENFKLVAEAINDWSISLKKAGILTCVVVLPYEMQISNDAKNYYRSIGINFDKSFEKFKTQEILKKNISKELEFFVLREGFQEKKIGYYYVFNKGDKIDFNHPNRAGHQVIAEQISKNKVCLE